MLRDWHGGCEEEMVRGLTWIPGLIDLEKSASEDGDPINGGLALGGSLVKSFAV